MCGCLLYLVVLIFSLHFGEGPIDPAPLIFQVNIILHKETKVKLSNTNFRAGINLLSSVIFSGFNFEKGLLTQFL